MHVQLVYFSGANNTAYLSALIEHQLVKAGHSVQRDRLEKLPAGWQVPDCDMLGIGAPVYHCTPPSNTLEFIRKLDGRKLPLFTFWSLGLYAGDCARIFQGAAAQQGFRPVANLEGIFPGVDGVMLATADSISSRINRRLNMRVEKKLLHKVVSLVASLTPNMPEKIEPRRWYVPLNDLFRSSGERTYESIKHKLHARPDRCTQGFQCVARCPQKAIRPSDTAVSFDPERCLLCLRCYHSCPHQAIALGDWQREHEQYAGPQQARNFVPTPEYQPPPIVCQGKKGTPSTGKDSA